jgi:hypothetical protein
LSASSLYPSAPAGSGSSAAMRASRAVAPATSSNTPPTRHGRPAPRLASQSSRVGRSHVHWRPSAEPQPRRPGHNRLPGFSPVRPRSAPFEAGSHVRFRVGTRLLLSTLSGSCREIRSVHRLLGLSRRPGWAEGPAALDGSSRWAFMLCGADARPSADPRIACFPAIARCRVTTLGGHRWKRARTQSSSNDAKLSQCFSPRVRILVTEGKMVKVA